MFSIQGSGKKQAVIRAMTSRVAMRWSRRSAAAVMAGALVLSVFPGLAGADSLVADGDGVTPVVRSAIDLGTICTSAPIRRNVLVVIKRTADTPDLTFANGSDVSIESRSFGGSSVNPEIATIGLPRDWEDLAPDSVSRELTISLRVLVSRVGADFGFLSFEAKGTAVSGESLADSDSMRVSWNAVSCNTAPTLTLSGVTNGASYDKGSVPVAMCNVVDAEDGNWSFAATLSAVTGANASDGIGSQTASCAFTDSGGISASPVSAAYSIGDPTPPTISPSVTGTLGLNGWYRSDVGLSWTVADDQSPNSLVRTGCVSQSITADQGPTGYSCSASSVGGTTGPLTETIKRDATLPTISAALAPAASGGGWNNTNVSVVYTCADSLSGIASCEPNQTLSDEGPLATYSGNAVDNAGNRANVGGTVKIDKTAPSVAVTGVTNGGSYVTGSVPVAGCSTTDSLSGVATSASATTTGGPIGSVTVTCSGARDVAGNAGSASATYTVTYAFTGFFQPVGNLPVVNVVNAGRAIPVKFSLGGNQGLGVIAAGFPTSKTVACGSTAGSVGGEQTVTAGGGSLSYDTLVGQYSYVWKTNELWTGTCRTLTVKLVDGSVHQANFRFNS